MKPDRALPGESQVKPPKPPTDHSGVSDAQPRRKPRASVEFATVGSNLAECEAKANIIAHRYFGHNDFDLKHIEGGIEELGQTWEGVATAVVFCTQWIAIEQDRPKVDRLG